jgi:phosphoribosylformylglycinamidine cyclo-ligase
MVCDDAVVRGGEPILIGSNLEINKVDIDVIKQLANGYVAAAKEANVAIINGEIAEVGSRVQGMAKCSYNWGATALWIGKKENLITGKEVKVGDTLIAFKEDGFRSNGLSLVRKIMHDQWTKETLSQALTPSKIYSRAVVSMFGKLHGVAHITGGGVPGKVGRMLRPSALGANFNNLFEPSKLMKDCIEKGKVPIEEAYKTWNMGNGMIITTNKPEDVIEIAKKHNIEAQICGEIIKEKQIELESFSGEKLVFKL